MLHFLWNKVSKWSMYYIFSLLFHQAAKLGAEATVDMKAKAGRASYVNVSQLTQKDPGAEAVSVWLEAVLYELCDQHK